MAPGSERHHLISGWQILRTGHGQVSARMLEVALERYDLDEDADDAVASRR